MKNVKKCKKIEKCKKVRKCKKSVFKKLHKFRKRIFRHRDVKRELGIVFYASESCVRALSGACRLTL